MRLNNLKPLFIVFLAFLMANTSCTTAKFQQGFSYHPAVEGPSIGSNQSNEPQIQPNELQQKVEQPIAIVNTNTFSEIMTEMQEVKATTSIEPIDKNEFIAEKTVTVKQTVQQMVTDYAAAHHTTISAKQHRYINKVLSNIEHKASLKSIIWEPQTNVELFFLLGAGVGLLVGLLGNGLGFFIFLVLALAYLYFKLLRD
jgi:hypothetical protein